MGLVFEGTQVPFLEGVSLKAFDEKTEAVVAVKVTSEALDDYGLETVQAVAEIKYDNGARAQDGSVSVTSKDCADAHRT